MKSQKTRKNILIITTTILLLVVATFAGKNLIEKNSHHNSTAYDVFYLYPLMQNPKTKKEYLKQYDKLFPYFLINEAKVNSKKLDFIRLGLKGDDKCIYIVPKYALEKADAVIGYGIDDSISFEEGFSDIYNKNSYGYDCGIKSIPIKNKKCHFKSECIGTDRYVLFREDQTSSKNLHSYGENLKKLNLKNKKIFLKMDIAGAETEVMDDILNDSKNITGMALAIHLYHTDQFLPTIKMLKKIEKNFILVERNNLTFHIDSGKIKFKCPRGKGDYSAVIILSYINKDLVDEYKVADNQSSLSIHWEGSQYAPYPTDVIKSKLYPTIIKKNIIKFFDFDLPKLFKNTNNSFHMS